MRVKNGWPYQYEEHVNTRNTVIWKVKNRPYCSIQIGIWFHVSTTTFYLYGASEFVGATVGCIEVRGQEPCTLYFRRARNCVKYLHSKNLNFSIRIKVLNIGICFKYWLISIYFTYILSNFWDAWYTILLNSFCIPIF